MPAALTASELSRIREDIEDQLTGAGVLLSGSAAADGAGGQTVTWGTLLNNVPCRFTQENGREQQAGGGMRWYTRNLLTVPTSVPIAAGHRFVYGGRTYAVTNVTVSTLLCVKRVILENV